MRILNLLRIICVFSRFCASGAPAGHENGLRKRSKHMTHILSDFLTKNRPKTCPKRAAKASPKPVSKSLISRAPLDPPKSTSFRSKMASYTSLPRGNLRMILTCGAESYVNYHVLEHLEPRCCLPRGNLRMILTCCSESHVNYHVFRAS